MGMGMQDRYVGDIGDYCKLGLLRSLTESGLTLSINWYKTEPDAYRPIKQNEGKFTEYVMIDEYKDCYSHYDKDLHRELKRLIDNKNRKIESIGTSIIKAKFYNDRVLSNQHREAWHHKALKKLSGTDVVFLDPDNGIETEKMMGKGPSQKHVRWSEIEEYYKGGQSVIIYQHKYRITDSDFIKKILQLQRKFIKADSGRIVKYSSYGIRYFILLLHDKHCPRIDDALSPLEKQGQVVTTTLKSIKKKKNVPEFCKLIYPRRK